jgi:hypothetical protein
MCTPKGRKSTMYTHTHCFVQKVDFIKGNCLHMSPEMLLEK